VGVVGSIVGGTVGEPVGRTVGGRVGDVVGKMVGKPVGMVVGVALGAEGFRTEERADQYYDHCHLIKISSMSQELVASAVELGGLGDASPCREGMSLLPRRSRPTLHDVQ